MAFGLCSRKQPRPAYLEAFALRTPKLFRNMNSDRAWVEPAPALGLAPAAAAATPQRKLDFFKKFI